MRYESAVDYVSAADTLDTCRKLVDQGWEIVQLCPVMNDKMCFIVYRKLIRDPQ